MMGDVVRICLETSFVASVAGVLVMLAPTNAPSQTSEEATEVLFLVTERVVGPSSQEASSRFWWSNPTEPRWTETDRQLREALQPRGLTLLRPGQGARISRIYQRPDLSLNNAAALASILGARRIVFGSVTYRRTDALASSGIRGVTARASLKLVDVTASSPEVLRTYEISRSVYHPRGDPRSTSSSALERARSRIVDPIVEVLTQTLSIVEGRVGIDSETPLITFHGLERAAALESIQRALQRLESIETTSIRWAAEGIIALELQGSDEQEQPSLPVSRAVEMLDRRDFEALRLTRRESSDEIPHPSFEVQITGTMSLPAREGERRERGDERRTPEGGAP